jgi:proteasome component ECM29
LTSPNRREATLAAAVESLFASINPAVLEGDSMMRAASRSLELAQQVAQQAPSKSIWRSIYSSLKQLFERLSKTGKQVCFSGVADEKLRLLLFGQDPGTEALRLLRAEAIVEGAELSPAQAAALRTGILALEQEEKSTAVRDRLAQASTPPG